MASDIAAKCVLYKHRKSENNATEKWMNFPFNAQQKL